MKTLSCFVFVTMLIAVSALGQAAPTALDDFSNIASWKVIRADGVECTTQADSGPGASGETPNSCIRIDYRFTKGAGYCIIQKPFSIEPPEATSGRGFEISFDIRGEGPANNLELKLLDTRGDAGADAEKSDVWWVNRMGYEWPREWRTVRNKRRHFTFAWGPSGGKEGSPTRVDKIEFAIASGVEGGGEGSVWIDNLVYREIEAPPDPLPTPTAAASSSDPKASPPASVLDASDFNYWRPMSSDSSPSLTIDLGYEQDIGGVEVSWFGSSGNTYALQLSLDGREWTTARRSMQDAQPWRQIHPLPDTAARFIRLAFDKPIAIAPGHANRSGIATVTIRDPAFSASPNVMFSHIAKDEGIRGGYPKYFKPAANYWTIIGSPGTDQEALIDQFGNVEPRKSGFSIAPVVKSKSLACPAELAEHSHSLADGGAPIPTVVRSCEHLDLSVTAFMDNSESSPELLVRYVVTNKRSESATGTLLLTVRPFQVLPPSQNLNITGGVTPIASVEWNPESLLIDQRIQVRFSAGGTPYALTFTQGHRLMYDLSVPRDETVLKSASRVDDPDSLMSAVVIYPFDLSPGQSAAWHISIPPDGTPHGSAPSMDSFDSRLAACRAEWEGELGRATVKLPPSASRIEDTIRSTLAYILINADGPAIQPGSRNYERSWIRDGALTSSALLAFGHADKAVAFLDWYAERIDLEGPAAGKVPCVVDKRGPDPVPENDSHGEYLYAVMNAYRYTRDESLLRRYWPRVRAVVSYIERLRNQRLTAEFSQSGQARREPGKPHVPALAFRGLVPESISHEGYSAKPMHSYWDDWWTLRGLRDAAEIALALGDIPEHERIARLALAFTEDLKHSIELARAAHSIEYMPGCVELGDFDSTSTTVAVWPCAPEDYETITGGAIGLTFDRYWKFFEERAKPGAVWEAFTPYELRHVGVFARLGQRERALKTLEWFMQFQRPQGWNHWAEVVFKDVDTPKFIGDMPHTWCGSDFLNSVRAMLVYEREGGANGSHKTLELFRGVPEEWIDASSVVSFRDLRTWFGSLSASIQRVDRSVRVRVAGRLDAGTSIVVRNPMAAKPTRITVDGAAITSQDDAAVITQLPSVVEFEHTR